MRTLCPSLVAALLAWFWLGTAAAPLAGQVVRGRIVLEDGITPAVGVVITAIGADSKRSANALSGSTGEYVLSLPASGRYELRVLRIGFKPTIVGGVEVSRNSQLSQNITLDRVPIVIAGMSVRERADCGLAGRDAEIFIDLWEQARSALTAIHLSESSGVLDVRLMRTEGRVDAMNFYAPDTVGSPLPEVDSSSTREWVADRLFATAPAETIEVAGYIRRQSSGGVIYDAPSADVLLSDVFLQTHCFSVVGPPKAHPEWIGIAFVPRGRRDGIVEVMGTLWLDHSTAELRRLEFQYTNVPHAVYEMCEGDPPQNPPKRVCTDFSEDGTHRFGVGGDADFQRLSTGEWLAVRWTIRTLSGEMNYRPAHRKVRFGQPKETCSGPVKPFPKRGDCVEVLWPVPRLSFTSTVITRLARSSVELYRDDAAAGLINAVARKQAGEHPANLEGQIIDGAQKPLRNAIVQTESPNRVEMTDTIGRFRIQTLPARPIVFSVRCRGFKTARYRLPLLPDSTRRVSIGLLPDGRPNPKTNDCSRPPE